MAKISSARFKGKTGEYDFDVYEWGTEFKALGAVYIITTRTVDNSNTGRHTFIYIGQTGDLSERFDNHHKAKCFTRNGVNCICIHLESSERSRLAIESDLLAANTTPCND